MTFTGNVPWNSLEDNLREPLASEREGGFPCGEADQALFNWLQAYQWGQIHNAILGAGLTEDLDDLQQLSQAIRSMIINRGRTVLGLTRVPWLAVESIQASAPPASPSVGELYLVSPAAAASGDWAGHQAELAEYVGVEAGGWIFQSVQNGTVLFAKDQEIPYIKDDGGWRQYNASESQYGFVLLANGSAVDALADPNRPVVPLHLGRVIKPLRGPQGLAVADNWGDPANVKPGFAPRRLTGAGSNSPSQIGDGSEYYVENIQDQGQPNAFFRLAWPASVASGKPVLFSTRNDAGAQSEWIELTDKRSLQRFGNVPRDAAIFLSSGTFIVPDGVYKIKARVIGGGGGGGGGGNTNASGRGGGGGGYVEGSFAVTPGQSIPVTVGAGGAGGGASGTNGASGGSSSLGALASAGGGEFGGGSGSGIATAGGGGGSASGGYLAINGTAGATGVVINTVYGGGQGGGSVWSGFNYAFAINNVGSQGTRSGQGGGGASGANVGGQGADGLVIIEY